MPAPAYLPGHTSDADARRRARSRPRPGALPARPSLRLRLLETTDVHANLVAHDYYADLAARPYGLTRTATLIAEARREARNCLLFDNGDFLQGTPLSDLLPHSSGRWAGPHPVMLAMNALRYDAAALGNHEFNFGLTRLLQAVSEAEFPVTCANAITCEGATPADDDTLLPPYVMLDRCFTDDAGARHDLRIGIIGLLPPQVMVWDHAALSGEVTSRDIVDTARARVPQVRAAGADIVVILAHSGIDPGPARPGMENALRPLARVDGIDAILAGHTHETFPVPDRAGGPPPDGVDPVNGRLHGVPTVMGGFKGSHLGVIDLDLRKTPDGWQVASHHCEARPVARGAQDALTPEDGTLRKVLKPAHDRTRQLIRKPIGHSATALHSYLSLVRDDPALRLVTAAQRAALTEALSGSPHAGLPVLSASAPFRTGGRGGAEHYTDIPPGPLSLRHAADLYCFPNTLCGLRLTGAEVRDWLERAAICFNRLIPGDTDQRLRDMTIPGHDFDVIDGLSYRVDLSQPARYDGTGNLVDAGARRIRALHFNGKPLDDKAEFILATNSYRAFGSGPYADLTDGRLVHVGNRPVRDLVARHVARLGTIRVSASPPIWHFRALPAGTSALFDTGPGLRRYPEELERLAASVTGQTPAGFLRLLLPMDRGPHVAAACESVE